MMISALFCRETEELVSRLEQPEPGSSPLAFDDPYPQPLWRQTLIILVKNLVSRCFRNHRLSQYKTN